MKTRHFFVKRLHRFLSPPLFSYILLFIFLILLIVLNVEDSIPATSGSPGVDRKPEWNKTLASTGDIDAQQFAEQLYTGQAELIRGVYAAGRFALPVIQQPEGKNLYVSSQMGRVTQFNLAADQGVTGLLAHNFLSGIEFYELEVGDQIWIIYGDKELVPYQITTIRTYQKLEPSNLRSDYHDLTDHSQLSTSELFRLYYRGPHHVTFQTCLEQEGLLNWGLLFVVATRLEEP